MLNNLLAETTTSPGKQNPAMLWIFVALIVVIIGLFVWQTITNKKKQKQAQEQVAALKKGDRVKTIGGICGFVHEINDAENTFVLETGSGDFKSYVKFDKAAIYQTAPAEGYANAPAEESTPKKEEKAKKSAKSKQEPVEEGNEESPFESDAEKSSATEDNSKESK